MTNYILFSPEGSSGAPNATGNSCSISTEDVEVSINIYSILIVWSSYV